MLINQLKMAKSCESQLPSWVSRKEGDLTERVWQAIQVLRVEKLANIKAYNKRRDMKRKGDYTISKKEIAGLANCAPPSLHNRPYSKDLENTLAHVNDELVRRKNERVEQLVSVGRVNRRREEVDDEFKKLRAENDRLKIVKVAEVVEKILNQLPLKARKAAGLS
jgi:hypothetical protein